jgi:ABC-type uncharacterized transport system permease subunit
LGGKIHLNDCPTKKKKDKWREKKVVKWVVAGMVPEILCFHG